MIRINLLGGERQKAARTTRFDLGQQMTAVCGLVVVAAACGIGYWYWSLRGEAASLDAQIAAARREAARLDTVLAEVKTFEDRRATLQQRVTLIEGLRQGQTVPVQVLDHVSRSMPEMLWLTDMKQEGQAITIEGRSTTLIGLSDFVGNLAGNPILKRPIEIVDSQVEAAAAGPNKTPGQDLIMFKVRAVLNGLPEPPEQDSKAKKGKR